VNKEANNNVKIEEMNEGWIGRRASGMSGPVWQWKDAAAE
jgi:hypothetical protein